MVRNPKALFLLQKLRQKRLTMPVIAVANTQIKMEIKTM